MSSIETFELRQAYGEQLYWDGRVTEFLDDEMPQLTNQQIDRMIHALEVELRERGTKFNPNQEVF